MIKTLLGIAGSEGAITKEATFYKGDYWEDDSDNLICKNQVKKRYFNITQLDERCVVCMNYNNGGKKIIEKCEKCGLKSNGKTLTFKCLSCSSDERNVDCPGYIPKKVYDFGNHKFLSDSQFRLS